MDKIFQFIIRCIALITLPERGTRSHTVLDRFDVSFDGCTPLRMSTWVITGAPLNQVAIALLSRSERKHEQIHF